MRWTGRARDRSVALIWVAVFASALVAMFALAADTAYYAVAVHQLQNAADSAALAGALKVRASATEAHQAAYNVAAANHVTGCSVQLVPNTTNDPAGDIVIGSYNRTTHLFTPTLTQPNAVKVLARRTSGAPGGCVSLFFGGIYGVPTAEATRTAIAVSGSASSTGILILDAHRRDALHANGNATLSVPKRTIQVNSDDSRAVTGNGNVTIDSGELDVTGSTRFTGTANITGELNTGVAARPDPLSGLPAPPWSATNDLGKIDGKNGQTYNLQPGYYSGGISANGGTINLAPGIYVLDGAGVYIRGGATIRGEGVMLYIKGGAMDLAGNGAVYLTPPDRALHSYPNVGLYEGITIFQSRTNTATSRIIGTSQLDINGTVYIPKAELDIGGTGGSLANCLIANTLDVSGTARYTIDYDPNFPVPGGGAFLVR